MSDHEKLREAIERVQEILGPQPIAPINRDLVLILDAAKSTLPKTKEVEVWRVEYAVVNGARDDPEAWRLGTWTYRTEADARKEEEEARNMGSSYDCIRVTGPHKQTVPCQ